VNLASMRWQLDKLTESMDPGMEVRLRVWDEAEKRFRTVDIRLVVLIHHGADPDDEPALVLGPPYIQLVADEHLDEFGNELYYAHDRQAA
jgi:hypothetical protein